LLLTWNTFGARTSRGQTQTHKTHHSPDLGEATTLPLILFFLHGHRANSQMSFCLRVPKLRVLKFSKLGLPRLWKPITSCVNFWLRWDVKHSCSPHQELSNNMWHATYTQVKQGNSRLLVVGSQIGNLTFDLSFGHKLCFKYSNGSCKPISDI
jgi:hypothetical protein